MSAELYLYTPDGRTKPVEEDTLTASSQVATALTSHDWVEMRREGILAATRWTVIQRNSSGCPEFIGVENWAGEVSVLSNTRRP